MSLPLPARILESENKFQKQQITCDDMDKILLPSSVRPKKYTLHLEPDLEKATFKGEVVIDLDVKEETNEIRFHANELTILSVSQLHVAESCM